MTQTGTSEAPGETLKQSPKDASASVVGQHAATLKALPSSDTGDFHDASRGFLGPLEHARIASAQGRARWSLQPCAFPSLKQAPPNVDPNLHPPHPPHRHHRLIG